MRFDPPVTRQDIEWTGRRVKGRKVYRVLRTFIYRAGPFGGGEISIPAGFETDLVSAPWYLRWALPLKHMMLPAIVHDYARKFCLGITTSGTDLIFLEAMYDCRVREPYKTLSWLAVRSNNNRA